MRVVVANLHSGGNGRKPETVAALRDLLPSAGWAVLACEAQAFHKLLAPLGRVSGSTSTDRSRGECIVVTSRDVTVLRAETFKVCESGGTPVQPDRYATEVRVVDNEGRRWYLLSWHGHANVQNRVTGRPRRSLGAREYALGMGELARRVEVAQEAGYTAVVGGDANWVDRRPAWKWSPRVVFEDLGLAVRSHRVDYLATDASRLVLTEPLRVVPPPPGCDHSWLVADVAMKGAPVSATITSRVVTNLRKRGVTVYHRHQWGSDPDGRKWPLAPDVENVYTWRRVNKPHQLVPKQPSDTLVQHITVTQPSGDLRADARVVERIGFERFGSGVSYNWLVDMTTGEVAVGMPLDAKGTHTVNDKNVSGFSYDQNYVALAVAVVGMPQTLLSKQAQASISHLIAALIEEKALTPGHDYVPHSLFAYKDCPCDNTRTRMAAMNKAGVKEAKS